MKKFKWLAGMIIISLLMSGCSLSDITDKLPFGNKNEEVEQPGDEEGMPYTPDVLLTALDSYPVGTILTYTDVTAIEAGYEFEVVDNVFTADGIEPTQEYEVIAGEQTVNIIIQFTNGSQFASSMTITGESAMFPPELQTNVNSAEWENKRLSFIYYAASNIYSLSYVPDNVSEVVEGDVAFGLEPSILGDNNVWSAGLVSQYNSDMFYLPNNIMWKVGNALDRYMSDSEEDDLFNYIKYLVATADTFGYISDQPTEVSLYDVDGNSYPIREIIYDIDLTAIGGAAGQFHGVYYVQLDSDTRMYFDLVSRNSVLPRQAEDIVIPDGVDISTVITDEDTFVNYITENKDALSSVISDVGSVYAGNYDVQLQEFANSVLIDKVQKEQEAPTGNVDSDGSSEEKPELSDTAGKTFTTYASRYPEIYTWPETEIKYRRWIYVISDTTRYNGSIINPDGTIITSSGTITGITGDGNHGSYDANGDGTINGSQKYTLTSTYGSYNVSNETLGQATFDSANSTAGLLIINYNGKKYYIETVRASRILEYQRSCLYSTDDMKNGDYQVFEDSSKTATNIGQITLYTVKYTTSNDIEITEPYMATYNINNDYLVVYSDSLIGQSTDDKTFITLLTELIK